MRASQNASQSLIQVFASLGEAYYQTMVVHSPAVSDRLKCSIMMFSDQAGIEFIGSES